MDEHDSGNSRDGDKPKREPSHRVAFSRITGQDRQGRDILGPAREIGAIWDRQGKEGEGILRFDHIPEELSWHGGVVFVRKTERETGDAKTPVKRSRDNDRDR